MFCKDNGFWPMILEAMLEVDPLKRPSAQAVKNFLTAPDLPLRASPACSCMVPAWIPPSAMGLRCLTCLNAGAVVVVMQKVLHVLPKCRRSGGKVMQRF